MNDILENVKPLDWKQLEDVAERSQSILKLIAADRRYLRYLVDKAQDDPILFGKCELHDLDDKIVLHDAMETKHFRIRFRLATAYQDERPHQHRFSFSTLILKGNYFQNFYRTEQALDAKLNVDRLKTVISREEPVGSSFTIHHDVIHSTIAPPDTISLVLRGPAMKQRAIIAHKETGHIEWREGEQTESANRREHVAMPKERFLEWREKLLAARII